MSKEEINKTDNNEFHISDSTFTIPNIDNDMLNAHRDPDFFSGDESHHGHKGNNKIESLYEITSNEINSSAAKYDSVDESQEELTLLQNTIVRDVMKDHHRFASSQQIAWKVHPDKNVEYICKTENIGLCSKCLYQHYKEGHKISCIKEVLSNLSTMIEQMELKVMKVNTKNKSHFEESKRKLDEYISNKNHLLQE